MNWSELWKFIKGITYRLLALGVVVAIFWLLNRWAMSH